MEFLESQIPGIPGILKNSETEECELSKSSCCQAAKEHTVEIHIEISDDKIKNSTFFGFFFFLNRHIYY